MSARATSSCPRASATSARCPRPGTCAGRIASSSPKIASARSRSPRRIALTPHSKSSWPHGKRRDAIVRIERGRIAMLRPPPIDPFPPAATRARQACESQDRPSPVFRAEPAPRRIVRSPGAAPPFRHRSPAPDTRPRALDREARLLPRSDGNAPRAAPGCRARSRHRATDRDRLGGDEFRPVMVRDPAEQVAAHEQQLRQRDQVFEGRTFGATKLQALDRCRQIGDGDSAARIASGVDHDAFFKPVSSAG